MECKHCWHTSVEWGNGHTGSDTSYCCHCGVMAERKWRIEHKPVPGHGKYFQHSVKVYEDTPEAK